MAVARTGARERVESLEHLAVLDGEVIPALLPFLLAEVCADHPVHLRHLSLRAHLAHEVERLAHLARAEQRKVRDAVVEKLKICFESQTQNRQRDLAVANLAVLCVPRDKVLEELALLLNSLLADGNVLGQLAVRRLGKLTEDSLLR